MVRQNLLRSATTAETGQRVPMVAFIEATHDILVWVYVHTEAILLALAQNTNNIVHEIIVVLAIEHNMGVAPSVNVF